MKTFRREPALGFTALLLVSLMGLFILLPQLEVLVAPGVGGYQHFLSENSSWVRALQNSLAIVVLSTATSVALGFFYAYAVVYSNMPWKPFFRLIAILPMLSPPFAVAFSYILLFGPRGLITYGLLGQSPNILGLYGLWGVQTIAFFPYAYQLVADVLSRSDPRLEQAARNLGANSWQIFRTVTIPLTRPGLLSAVLLVAIYVLEDFGNPALIAGQFTVLPTLAYGLISGFGDFAGAAVVSSLLLALALVFWLLRLALEGRGSFTTIGGRGTAIPRPPVPAPVTWVSFGISLALAGLILLVYGALLVSAVVKAFPFNLAPTLEHFAYVGTHFDSLRNSLVYASAAAVISAAFAIMLAYLVQRHSWWGRRVVDFAAVAPAAIPGIFFGVGYAITFNQPWLTWIDRGTLIVLSMIFWNIPMGYQAAVAGLKQVDRSLDDAASILGASGLRCLRDVLLPLLRGAFATGLVTAFVRAITTLSVLIFLFTPSTTVATISVFQLVSDFDWGGAAAFTVALIGVAVAVVTVVSAVSARGVSIGGMRNG